MDEARARGDAEPAGHSAARDAATSTSTEAPAPPAPRVLASTSSGKQSAASNARSAPKRALVAPWRPATAPAAARAQSSKVAGSAPSQASAVSASGSGPRPASRPATAARPAAPALKPPSPSAASGSGSASGPRPASRPSSSTASAARLRPAAPAPKPSSAARVPAGPTKPAAGSAPSAASARQRQPRTAAAAAAAAAAAVRGGSIPSKASTQTRRPPSAPSAGPSAPVPKRPSAASAAARGTPARPPAAAPQRLSTAASASAASDSSLLSLPEDVLLRILCLLGPREALCRARLWSLCRRLRAAVQRVQWPTLHVPGDLPGALLAEPRAAALFRALRSRRLLCGDLTLDACAPRQHARTPSSPLTGDFWTSPKDGPRFAALAPLSGLARLSLRHGPLAFRWPRPPKPWLESNPKKRPRNAYPLAVISSLAPLAPSLSHLSLAFETGPQDGPPLPEDRLPPLLDALRPFSALRSLSLRHVAFADAGKGGAWVEPLPSLQALELECPAPDAAALAAAFPNLTDLVLCLETPATAGPPLFRALAPLASLRRLELLRAGRGRLELGMGSLPALAEALGDRLVHLRLGDGVGSPAERSQIDRLAGSPTLRELELDAPLRPHKNPREARAVGRLAGLRRLRCALLVHCCECEEDEAPLFGAGAFPELAELDLAVTRFESPRSSGMSATMGSCRPTLLALAALVAALPALRRLALRVDSPAGRDTVAAGRDSAAAAGLLEAAGPLLAAYRRTGLWGPAPELAGELAALAGHCPAVSEVLLEVYGPTSVEALAPLASLRPSRARLVLHGERGAADAAALDAARRLLPRFEVAFSEAQECDLESVVSPRRFKWVACERDAGPDTP